MAGVTFNQTAADKLDQADRSVPASQLALVTGGGLRRMKKTLRARL
jgi:hypothetical protein